MKNKIIISIMVFVIPFFSTGCGTNSSNNKEQTLQHVENTSKKLHIQIILGSTRKGRTSEKIGTALQQLANKRPDITAEIVDLRHYPLPFLADEVPPASRQTITDPEVQKWSDKIKQADAFIIICPEYNAGYPGVLKNALDSLYKEWNNKPVALVGYSGGSSGGASAIAQLRQVVTGLEMIPVQATILIPTSWKAFDSKGALTYKNLESELNSMIDQLIKVQPSSGK